MLYQNGPIPLLPYPNIDPLSVLIIHDQLKLSKLPGVISWGLMFLDQTCVKIKTGLSNTSKRPKGVNK